MLNILGFVNHKLFSLLTTYPCSVCKHHRRLYCRHEMVVLLSYVCCKKIIINWATWSNSNYSLAVPVAKIPRARCLQSCPNSEIVGVNPSRPPPDSTDSLSYWAFWLHHSNTWLTSHGLLLFLLCVSSVFPLQGHLSLDFRSNCIIGDDLIREP